jgi:hypothetical protein
MTEKLSRAGEEQEDEPVNPNVTIAADLLTRPRPESPDSLLAIYNGDHQPIDTVEIETHRPAANVLYMSELLIGHKDSAVKFYLDTVDRINDLPDEMKPDVAVLSGLMQGDFRHLEKARRATLVPGLTTMDAQFKYARQMIEKLQTTGTPVIYNLSNDDRRVAEENTYDRFREMEGLAKTQLGTGWAKQDRMRQHPQWNTHYQFQLEEIVPYCLRAGRTLYTAEQMYELTGGQVAIDEYFLLFNAKTAIEMGEKIPPAHAAWMKQVQSEQIQDLIVTDDLNLHIKTDGKRYTDWIRHYMALSPQTMPQNHMATPLAAVAQRAANGLSTPDMLVTEHYQEDIGVGNSNKWVVSTGGMLDANHFFNAPGRRTDAKSDVSRRLATTRRRVPSPSATMHERTDDGRHIVTVMNDTLYEKSFSLPDRMTIAELCDFQTGSITARPDLLAKYLDYIRTKAMGERATAIFFGGDMIHGRNYPHFPSESQMTGLMAMDSQEAFNMALFRGSFSDVSAEELGALKKVLVQPGNHEWNSGTLKWHGYSFTTYMRELFGRMYARAGYSDDEIAERIKSHEATITPKGEYSSGYTGVEYFGDMGVLIQHYLLERGGKGSGGGPPIYQADGFASGSGDLMKNVDVFMAGHWHHPQYGVFGDKLAVVGGSMAGLSDYELKRGYRPTPSGTLLHIGGGLPPQVEFVSEEALHNHKITTGDFTDRALEEAGYRGDEQFDIAKHGIFLPDNFPKSALQKSILARMREASQRADKISILK